MLKYKKKKKPHTISFKKKVYPKLYSMTLSNYSETHVSGGKEQPTDGLRNESELGSLWAESL